jgi:hypothetical protein
VGASPGIVLFYGRMFYRAVVCLLRGRSMQGIGRVYARGLWFSGLYRLSVLVLSGCPLLKLQRKASWRRFDSVFCGLFYYCLGAC